MLPLETDFHFYVNITFHDVMYYVLSKHVIIYIPYLAVIVTGVHYQEYATHLILILILIFGLDIDFDSLI